MMINLRNIVRAMPHGAAMRKRVRVLRGVKPSRKIELWYKAELLKIVAALRRETAAELLPTLRQIVPALNKSADSMTHDAVVPRRPIEHSLTKLAQKFGGIEDTANRLATSAAQRSLAETDKRLAATIGQSVQVDISAAFSSSGPIRGVMESAVQANVDLIKSIPSQYFERLEKSVWDNMIDGVRFEDLAAQIQHIADVTESRAKLIARDQTSKMNGAFNEARQTSVGIDKYIWSTSGDERVREEHAANDGKIFDWNDPPATGHPGEDIQCRCVALPYVELDKEDGT